MVTSFAAGLWNIWSKVTNRRKGVKRFLEEIFRSTNGYFAQLAGRIHHFAIRQGAQEAKENQIGEVFYRSWKWKFQ